MGLLQPPPQFNPLQPPPKAKRPKFRDRDQFERILRENLSHTGPVSSDRLLKGREDQLRQFDRAFASPRQHLFIIGERGVGKTSLAMTAWRKRFGDKQDVPSVFCDPFMSFDGLMHAIATRVLGSTVLRKDHAESGELGFDLTILKGSLSQSGTGEYIIPDRFESADFSAQFLKAAVQQRGDNELCLVLDEFDRLPSGDVQSRFADLVKAIHDQAIPVRFICCGVSDNVRGLLGAHQSAGRSIIPVEVPRLTIDSLASIIFDASAALGINVPREFAIRACQISDGFPYFVHLLAHNLFFEVYEHIGRSNEASSADFHAATKAAIAVAEYELRDRYAQAVRKTKNSLDYEEVLWAFSDGRHFERQIRQVYDGTYVPMKENAAKSKLPTSDQDDGAPTAMLSYSDFSSRVRRLQHGDHGEILISPRRSWYRFCENRLRGYVRLVAQAHKVELGQDHF